MLIRFLWSRSACVAKQSICSHRQTQLSLNAFFRIFISMLLLHLVLSFMLRLEEHVHTALHTGSEINRNLFCKGVVVVSSEENNV